jgi:serine/threonine protein kinase
VPIALGGGTSRTEEGRVFFQNRLALYGGWVFLISGGFYLVGMAMRAAYEVAFSPATLFHLIGPSMLLGTPAYIAPEAISGEWDVDGRSDLYAVGAVGYFLLTGSPVFRARTIVEVCAHHLHSRPEPPSQRAGRAFPADLERIILQCLAKSPADRPPNARSLQRDLLGCAAAARWSMDQAARWWATFRQAQAHAHAASAPAVPSSPETGVVDLVDRLPMWR